MSGNASAIYPGIASGIEQVTDSLIIDTGLVKVKSFSVTLATTPVAAEASASGVLQAVVDGATRKLQLVVVDADGVTAGIAEVDVAWTAIEA